MTENSLDKSPQKLYWTGIPQYEVFFDHRGALIRYIHENDAVFRSEYQSSLLEHFGIKVEYFELPERTKSKLEKIFYDGKEPKYDKQKESLEEAVIRLYVKPELQKIINSKATGAK
jgi:hypothetical protein